MYLILYGNKNHEAKPIPWFSHQLVDMISCRYYLQFLIID